MRRTINTDPRMPKAEFLGVYKGKRIFRFVVRVRFNDSRVLGEVDRDYHTVVAATGGDACNYVRDYLVPLDAAQVEIDTRGPKGGVSYRYIGWESCIWRQMCAAKSERQRDLLNADVEDK